MLAHKILILKADPIKYLMTKPIPSSRMTRWMLILTEFDITITHPKGKKKSQIFADLLASSLHKEDAILSEEVPSELPILAVDCVRKTHKVGGGISHSMVHLLKKRGGVGIVITSLSGQKTTMACKLSFECSNNEAEYEALALGVITTLTMGIRNVNIKGDSCLVIQQM